MAEGPISMSTPKAGLFELLGKFDNSIGELPPVDSWNPKLSGDMDIVIKPNGDWIHEGDLIEREKLSRLFSSIIKKEGADYFLVTPVEKWRIQVEDQPFTIVLCHAGEAELSFITNMGEEVVLCNKEQLILDDDHEAPRLLIRNNLYARLNRATYYQVVAQAKEHGDRYFIESNGNRFYIN